MDNQKVIRLAGEILKLVDEVSVEESMAAVITAYSVLQQNKTNQTTKDILDKAYLSSITPSSEQ